MAAFDDPALGPLLDLTRSGALPMLPPAHCVLPQSKAFLALAWELLEQGFFPAAEATAIRAHVPATFLDPARLRGRPYVVKPYLEREGKGVRFSSDLGRRARRRLGASEVIYQERVELARVRLPVATARGWHREERTLVFGVFLAGDDVAGVYTRAGAPITGPRAARRCSRRWCSPAAEAAGRVAGPLVAGCWTSGYSRRIRSRREAT